MEQLLNRTDFSEFQNIVGYVNQNAYAAVERLQAIESELLFPDNIDMLDTKNNIQYFYQKFFRIYSFI